MTSRTAIPSPMSTRSCVCQRTGPGYTLRLISARNGFCSPRQATRLVVGDHYGMKALMVVDKSLQSRSFGWFQSWCSPCFNRGVFGEPSA